MTVVLGPIESSALCATWATLPPKDGKAQCANGAFQIGIFSYKVDLGPDGVSDVVRRNLHGVPWDCINGECDWSYGPDVIFEMYDASGAPTSRWGMSRPQEIASRQLIDFLGDYTTKLLAVRGAAILLTDKLVTLQHELGYVHLYDLMADLYKAGWRDLDGWPTAINRPKQGWVDVTGNFASADAFWLAHEYQRLAAATQESPASGYPFPKVMMPPGFGTPYQSTDEILAMPATSEFGDFRAPDLFLTHRQIDAPGGFSFLIDEDQTLTPLLRSSSVADVSFYLYRTFKTLSTAYENLLKARKDGEALTGLVISPIVLDLFNQQGGGAPHHGPLFTPRDGASGGGDGLIFHDDGSGGGSTGHDDGSGSGSAGDQQKPSLTSPRTWPTAAKVVGGVAVAAAVGVAAVAAMGGFGGVKK